MTRTNRRTADRTPRRRRHRRTPLAPPGRLALFAAAAAGVALLGWLTWLGLRARPLVRDGSPSWSPDSQRLVLVVNDPDPIVAAEVEAREKAPEGAGKTVKPIVIDRYQFKRDVDGFLRGERSHLYLFDVTSKKAEILTPGQFDESAPAWSGSGSR